VLLHRTSYSFLYSGDFVGAQIVYYDDVPGPQRRTQDLLHQGVQPLAIGHHGHRHQRIEPGEAQGPQQGHGRAIIPWHTPYNAGPCWRPSLQAGQGQIALRCIDTFQALALGLSQRFPIAQARLRDARGLAFHGVERLFFAASRAVASAATGSPHSPVSGTPGPSVRTTPRVCDRCASPRVVARGLGTVGPRWRVSLLPDGERRVCPCRTAGGQDSGRSPDWRQQGSHLGLGVIMVFVGGDKCTP
jgi:hypothetical protein